MLEDILKSYKKKAELINWKKYNQNDLVFEYIKHENDPLAENYFAGIMCRYWGYSGRIYTKVNKHISFDECYDCVVDAIRYVLKKRVWENPTSSLYGDPKAPDKAIHIALKRQMALMLSKYNAQRRLSNFNTLSIDEIHENYNDSADGLLFGETSTIDTLRTYISEYFQNNKYLDAVFLDTICYGNMKYNEQAIIKHLKNFNEKDLEYFKNNYDLDETELKKTIYKAKQCSNDYLKIKLNSLLYSIKKEVNNSAQRS